MKLKVLINISLQIVDLALLVKQDKRAQPGDPSSRGHPPLSINYAEIQAGSLLNKSESCIEDAQVISRNKFFQL